jgi:F-type H+-transporting ATPase subunit a
MQNLFLSFDSSSKTIFAINWLRVIFPLLVLSKFWISPNQIQKTLNLVNSVLVKEIKTIFSININSGIFIIFNSLFLFIATINLGGLLPYVFTSTRHLVITLFLSIPFWLGIQIAGWFFTFNKIACHLVPIRTPAALIPFLVLIESLRNLIRPITLAVRLTANITAGHLLIRLLGSASSLNSPSAIQLTTLIVIILLLILEIAVALIQSYVFILLSSLYIVESIVSSPLFIFINSKWEK